MSAAAKDILIESSQKSYIVSDVHTYSVVRRGLWIRNVEGMQTECPAHANTDPEDG